MKFVEDQEVKETPTETPPKPVIRAKIHNAPKC